MLMKKFRALLFRQGLIHQAIETGRRRPRLPDTFES